MGRHWIRALTFGVISYFVACTPMKFDKLPPPKCNGLGANACVVSCEDGTCIDHIKQTLTVGNGLVDILIIDDNSGSMSFEQANVADRFGDFLDSLGDL